MDVYVMNGAISVSIFAFQIRPKCTAKWLLHTNSRYTEISLHLQYVNDKVNRP